MFLFCCSLSIGGPRGTFERYIREVHCGDPPMEREEKKEQKEQKELRTERKNKTRIIFKNPV